MKNRTLFFALSLIGLAASTPLLSGCARLFGSEAETAYTEYQTAMAEGNLPWARIALTRLTRVKQDVPDYWIELGKINVQLGEYAKAYEAFSRAHELDRSNVQVMSALTQLALLSGQIPLADQQARQLALLAPNNPAVRLVRGYVALKEGNLDKADVEADGLLADTPNDPHSNLLKARILIQRERIDDAIAVLERQHQAVRDDRSALRALTSIYRSRDDWRNVARVQSDLHRLDPKDRHISQTLVEALLRSGNVAAAATVSAPLLSGAAAPELTEACLQSWARYAPRGAVLPDAAKLASAAGDKRVAFADYFNRVGRPQAAAALLGGPKLPVTTANARWNGVMAQSMALQGRLGEARQLFESVLDREPDQVEALRGRSALAAAGGMAKQAIIDAQRLVSISPQSGEDRLLLARAYLAAGNKRDVRRTLWDAFQDLPDDERVLAELKKVLVSTGDADAVRRLDEEYADKRMAKLTKELV